MNEGTPFYIVERTGLKRGIILRGRSMPYKGVQWGGEQLIDLSWFPGNPVGVVQVVGPRWKPLTISGSWKDTFLVELKNSADLLNFPALSPAATSLGADAGGSTFVGGPALPSQRADRARAVRDAFTLLRKSGSLLRVEWGSLVRYGVLTGDNFTHVLGPETDIEFELEFTITGDTDAQPKPLPVPNLNALGLLKALLALLNELLNTLLAAAYAQQQWIRRIIGPIVEITSLITEILGTLQNIATQRLQTPGNVLTLLKGNMTSIVASCVSLINLIDVGKTAGIDAAEAALDPITVDLNVLLQSRIREQLRRIASEAARAQSRIDAQDTATLKGIVISPGGITLRDISQQAYGTPRNWKKLADFNSLPLGTVTRGQVVLIPNL
jgi:hypothetical protein